MLGKWQTMRGVYITIEELYSTMTMQYIYSPVHGLVQSDGGCDASVVEHDQLVPREEYADRDKARVYVQTLLAG